MFFEMTIFFGSFHDLGTGMHNRRMVTTIESRSDMRISVPGQFTAHIHGNLTREGNILGLFFAHQFFIIDIIMLADIGCNFIDGNILLFILRIGDIADCMFNQRQGDITLGLQGF